MKELPFSFGDVFKGQGQHFIRVHPGPFSLLYGFQEILPKVYNMEPREGDIWVLGCPKSGTTWLSEIVWTVYHEGNLETTTIDHFDRYHFPEMKGYLYDASRILPEGQSLAPFYLRNHVDEANEAASPRFLRSHLPLSLLPPNLLDTSKIIYVVRDPKDCCVSLYHMVKDYGTVKKGYSVMDMADDFLNDRVMMGPYPLSVKQYWEKRCHKNMLFLFYEEIKMNLPATLQKVAKFLGKNLDESKIDDLIDHLSLNKMKNNDAINMRLMQDMGCMGEDNQFIRKGIIGDHKNYFGPELTKKFDAWWKKYFDDPNFGFPRA